MVANKHYENGLGHFPMRRMSIICDNVVLGTFLIDIVGRGCMIIINAAYPSQDPSCLHCTVSFFFPFPFCYIPTKVDELFT